MMKLLRFSFVALMAMVFGNASAQGTTFDFDNDYAKLFPALAGVSANDSHDGDFTAATTSIAVDGFTVTVSAADEGVTNANRIWSGSPRLRMYSGTFTVSGKGIKKIEFTHKSGNFNFTTETGKLEDNIWTGEADEVVFKCSKNTQISKIVINGDSQPAENPQQPSGKTYTVAEAIAYTTALGADVESTEDIEVKGKICSIKYEYSAQYGTATYNISDNGQEGTEFTVYGSYYFDNKSWTEGQIQVKVGDEVIVRGKVINYKGTTPEFSNKKNYLVSINGQTKPIDTNPSTPETPTEITVAKALELINALEDGKTTSEEYLVKGFIVGDPDFQRKADGSLYGNANFTIADAKDGTNLLTVFRAKDFDNKNFTEETITLKAGDEVVLKGKLQKYVKNGEMTPELTNGYLVKVIAQTSGLVWDFTKWSEATIANLKADAAASKMEGWSDVEKKADAEAGNDPTEASKDNCFWSVAEPNADGVLTANGVVIEELKGLVWNKAYTTARSLAIAVNYPTALSDYAGPAYLWLGGGKKKVPCFTIPGVKAGSTITMEVESHKTSAARGVELYTGVDADNLVDAATKIGDTFTPTTKDSHAWTINKDCDVIVYNTDGCHIYKIEITAGTGIQAVKTVKVDNGYIYNLAGQRVDANYKGVVIKNGQKMIQK